MVPSTSTTEPVTRVVELLDLATKLKSSPVSVSDTSAEPWPPVLSPVSGIVLIEDQRDVSGDDGPDARGAHLAAAGIGDE